MTVGSHALIGGTSALKPWNNLLRMPLFSLFGKEKPVGSECLLVSWNALLVTPFFVGCAERAIHFSL
jgi:hypothetical protein